MTDQQPNGARTYRGVTLEGTAVEVTVENGIIAEVVDIPASDSLPNLFPILVDLQHNGSLGIHYNLIHAAEDLERVAAHLRRHGVGRCVATVTTDDYETLLKGAARLREVLDARPRLDRLYPGLFHEGVFISPEEGWRGAHSPDWIVVPDYAKVKKLDEASGNRIRFVNVAPEEPGGLQFVQEATADGKTVMIGHANPSAEIIRQAVRRGAAGATHFGNGAPPAIHRHRNPLWTLLAAPTLRVGLICDGFHLPPDLVKTVRLCKPGGMCFAVSDASGEGGLPSGEYSTFGNRKIVVGENRKISLPDSEILAGAWYQLDRGVEFLVQQVGLTLPEAWRMCSVAPAWFAGIELPRLAVGEEASFVVARWDGGLVLEQCVHAGIEALGHPARPADTEA